MASSRRDGPRTLAEEPSVAMSNRFPIQDLVGIEYWNLRMDNAKDEVRYHDDVQVPLQADTKLAEKLKGMLMKKDNLLDLLERS